jgi:predicted RNase H-like nuclease
MTRGKIFVGLDGYRNGWVAVWLLDDHQEIEYLPHIDALLQRDFTLAMIDIPIGLPDRGRRRCDEKARELLKPNQSRVFLDARRGFLDCGSQPEASAKGKLLDGKGVSVQLFGIVKKLREMDAVITPTLQHRLKECHPELVFWRLHGKKPVPKKNEVEGHELRKFLLKKEGISQIDSLIDTRLGRGAGIDDVLDACACSIAARDANADRPPLGGEVDAKGLSMEIHY